MSKIKLCVLAAVSAAVLPLVCAAGEIVDGVYRITVAEDETRDMTDAEASELIAAYNAGTVTEFRKCGKGTLASASLANYKGRIVSEPFVMEGGEVGRDIHVYRNLVDDPTEAGIDAEAAYLLNFEKEMLKKYNM